MTSRPEAERLHHLLDRARRGVILPAEGEQLAEMVGELEQQLDTARATTRRLNYRAQRAESKNTAFERAVSQWDVNERGTYIPHTSLRAIGIAAGTDVLGTVRHLKHFQRVEQAEARIRELEADLHRYEEVVVGELNEANIRLQRQAARAEATVARVRQSVDVGPVGSCCAHLIRAALNPPPAVKRCGCGRPDPGPCQPCPDNSPSLHCACDCTPTLTAEERKAADDYAAKLNTPPSAATLAAIAERIADGTAPRRKVRRRAAPPERSEGAAGM